MKKFLMVLALFLVSLCFLGCNEKESETVRLGSVGPLSGEVEEYGLTAKNGAFLAVKEINANGGVKVGDTYKQIEYVGFLNDEASDSKAALAFDTLYDSGVDFIVGAVTSGASEGLVNHAITKGIPVITPTGTADYLTVGKSGEDRDIRSNIFRACFYDSYQGQIMANFVKEQGYKKVAVLVNTSDEYSKGLADAFIKTCGSDVELKKVEYTKETTNFGSFFNTGNICDANYDAVFVPDYYQVVKKIIVSARENGYTKPLLGGDGWDGVVGQFNDITDETLKAKQLAYLNGCYFSNHFAVDSTDEKVKNFVTKYNAEYSTNPTSFAALGYDAVYIMKAAIEKAGTLKYDKVVEALSSDDFAVDCVTGHITYDENGNPRKAAVVLTFENGKMKFFGNYQ